MFMYSNDGNVVRPQQQQQRIRQRVHQPMLVKQQMNSKTQFYQSCWFWIFLILLVIAIIFCFNNRKTEVKPSFGYYF